MFDIGYENDEEGNAIIQLFGKTKDGKDVCVLDKNFDPYFYVFSKENLEKHKEKILNCGNERYYVKDVKIEEVKYLDKDYKVLKVIVNNPISVNEIKRIVKDMSDTYDVKEVDIPFYKRYLIDKKFSPLALFNVEGNLIDKKDFDICIEAIDIEQNEEYFSNPRILAFDIEAYTQEKRYPIEERDPIIMIAFCGNDGYKKVLTWKKFSKAQDYVEFVSDEIELLEKFKTIIKNYNPDYLVGYFTDGFDFPYIERRCRKYDVKFDIKNRPIKITRRRNSKTAKIKGLVHLDIYKFIRGNMGNALRVDSFDLGTIAHELLKERKIDADIEDIGIVWDHGKDEISKFIEYNLQDANLTLKLAEKILPNIEELVKLVGMPIFDVCRMPYSQLVENYLMKRAKEFNEIFPNKPSNTEIEKRRIRTYQGAFVIEPNPGLYRNIVVFDFKGFWPSILVAHNISLATLTNETKNSFKSPELYEQGKKVNYYFSKKTSFIPEVVKELIIRRNRVKDILKKDPHNKVLDGRYYGLKTLTNATYGYFGFFGARWYCRECGASITAFGRDYIEKVIKEAKKEKFGIIYSDTDSIFLELKKRSKKDSLKFLEKINSKLPEFIELDLEDFYLRGIFVKKKNEREGAKKKYALVTSHGEIKVRGFETIRRDWSLIAKEVQKNVLELILREDNPEKALKYVKDVIMKVKNRKIEVEKMIIKTQLKKNIERYDLVGPHVAVAQKMKEKGMYVGPGSVIRYVVMEGKGRIRERAKLPEECKGNEYDPEYYINNQIVPAIENIFNAVGYSQEQITEAISQSKLGKFI